MADHKTSKLNPNAPEYTPSKSPIDPYFLISHNPQYSYHNHTNPDPPNYSHNIYTIFHHFPPQPQHSTDHPHRRHFHDRTVANPPRRASNPRPRGGRAPRQSSGGCRRYIRQYNPRPRTRSYYVPLSSSTSHTPSPVSNNLTATTIMIKNIPTKYTREMLMEYIDEHCKLVNSSDIDHGQKHAYDFLYLPIDFRTTLNKGYAFVNFTSPQAASGFEEKNNSQRWPHFKSQKIIQVAKAKLQGKDEMLRHYERTSFTCNEEKFLPVLFNPARDGSNADLVSPQTIGRCIY